MGTASEQKITRVTPYFHHHQKIGATMMEKGGWVRPQVFTNTEEEVLNTRKNVGIIDAHSMGKFEIIGSDAYQFMQYVSTNDLSRLRKGEQGIYTCLCNRNGGIVDDVIIYYISETKLYFITNTLSRDRVYSWLTDLKSRTNYDVHIIDVTNSIAYLALQGPKSLSLMKELFGEDILELKYFEFINANLLNVPVLVVRTGYTGESGFELNFPSEYGHKLWEYIFKEGIKYGIKPVGGQAIQILRTEKAYRSHGTDMTEENNPFEAGLGWTVALKKEDFIGKKALLKIKEQGVEKSIKGFFIKDGTVLNKGTRILNGDNVAGFITTCYKSPTLNKTIALGYVYNTSFDHILFEADNGLHSILEITDIPFYDPEGMRLRLEK